MIAIKVRLPDRWKKSGIAERSKKVWDKVWEGLAIHYFLAWNFSVLVQV
jgi:hypothetical protein